MSTDSKGYLISGKTVRGLAENERQRRGYLSPLPKMTRRRYDGGSQLEHYVVTQTQTNPVLGLGINCAVTRYFDGNAANYGEQWFFAKPYERGVDRLDKLSGDEVRVYCRFIHGAIATGQRFLMCPQVGGGADDNDVVGDVVQTPNGYQWYGAHYLVNSASVCDVAYKPDIPMLNSYRSVFDQTLVGGAHAFKVGAANGTGETLFDGQLVILNLTEFGWRISEYSCRGA